MSTGNYFLAGCPVRGCDGEARWYEELADMTVYHVTHCPECGVTMAWRDDWARTDPTRDAAIAVTLATRFEPTVQFGGVS